jgi:anti-sigma regulatory factor (Ser/Thr protein kinase)
MPSRPIHTPCSHIRPGSQPSPYRQSCSSLDVMTRARQAVCTAAQLRKAAQEMARLAARRGCKACPVERPESDDRQPPERRTKPQTTAPDRVGGTVTHAASFGEQWPFRSFLELGRDPSIVPYARRHTRQFLQEWCLAGLSDTAELLVTELVTNAVKISREQPVRLWLLADRTQVMILVWDSSLLSPVPMTSGDDDENGRGLLLVETLSAQWGWYFLPSENGGKIVWALICPGKSYLH